MKYTIEEINSFRPEYSKTTVLRYTASPRKGKTYVSCVCECGNYFDIWVDHIKYGKGLSCGCYNRRNLNTKYENNDYYLHSVYLAMIRRCYNPDDNNYKNYGGRGVKVCALWRKNYQSFINWARKNGWEKGLHLDKDKLGNGLLYSPETCCFITPKENGDRKWNMKRYEYNGLDMTLASIGRLHGIKAKTLRFRIKDDKRTLHEAIAMGKERKHIKIK